MMGWNVCPVFLLSVKFNRVIFFNNFLKQLPIVAIVCELQSRDGFEWQSEMFAHSFASIAIGLGPKLIQLLLFYCCYMASSFRTLFLVAI